MDMMTLLNAALGHFLIQWLRGVCHVLMAVSVALIVIGVSSAVLHLFITLLPNPVWRYVEMGISLLMNVMMGTTMMKMGVQRTVKSN